jgi:hypothetical protein
LLCATCDLQVPKKSARADPGTEGAVIRISILPPLFAASRSRPGCQ